VQNIQQNMYTTDGCTAINLNAVYNRSIQLSAKHEEFTSPADYSKMKRSLAVVLKPDDASEVAPRGDFQCSRCQSGFQIHFRDQSLIAKW